MYWIQTHNHSYENPVVKCQTLQSGGHSDTVVTYSPPTSGVCSSNPGPYVGKLVVAYRWTAVYSTEP